MQVHERVFEEILERRNSPRFTSGQEGERTMRNISEKEFIVSPAGVTHLPTEASFTPNVGVPTTGHWRDGLLGKNDRYDPSEVKEAMRHLWAQYLLSR
jgi:hypothetical protein